MMICICLQLQVNVFEYDLLILHIERYLWIITNYILMVICTHHCFDRFTLFRDDFLSKFLLEHELLPSKFSSISLGIQFLYWSSNALILVCTCIYAYIFIPMCFQELWSLLEMQQVFVIILLHLNYYLLFSLAQI